MSVCGERDGEEWCKVRLETERVKLLFLTLIPVQVVFFFFLKHRRELCEGFNHMKGVS